MFKLESKRLKREFKISNDSFFASQILNKYSGMSLVPDGNGCEFVVHFEDGSELSAKGLPVAGSNDDGKTLSFSFTEAKGISVTVEYWVHDDGNSICKRLTVDQSDDKVIDYIILDNIGIVNSKTHFTVDIMPDSEISGYHATLGQPFYIDSLFFGCEFPATDNRIVHGAGQIKYYVGKAVGKNFKCPVTVMGGGRDNTITEVRKAFFEYIDFISRKTDLRFQYNSWYDNMLKVSEDNIKTSFSEVAKGLAFHNAPKLDAFVIDDGWNNYKAKFWEIDKKKFPEGLNGISKHCKKSGYGFGMWLGPRGGYNYQHKFAKKIQSAGNGFVNKNSKDICVASSKYIENVENLLIDFENELDVSYFKLDGFCLAPCTDPTHDHAVGGRNDMYFITDLWQKWITAFEHIRSVRENQGRDLWINMTCYTNVSPWWLQWVNSIWLQNSADIGFSKNQEEQAQVEAAITYRDSRYYDCICRRANQFPFKNLYNHEPIYAHKADVQYTDEEFEKYIYWCTVRGNALNELHISYDMMSESKWNSLAGAMNFQKGNYHILKNASFIGGDPEDNNIYGYISWTEDGEGIIALRNPTDEKTSLTLNLNKLMGAPEDLSGVKRYNVYCSLPENDSTYSYADKIDLTLGAYEIIIFKLAK